MFIPRVAAAWIAAASQAAAPTTAHSTSLPNPSDLSGWRFYGLYALLSRSATSSLRESKAVLDAILEFIFGLDGAADSADSASVPSLAFLTRCLSCCPYSSWEEVLHVITSVNLRVYLTINQSEAYDILHQL